MYCVCIVCTFRKKSAICIITYLSFSQKKINIHLINLSTRTQRCSHIQYFFIFVSPLHVSVRKLAPSFILPASFPFSLLDATPYLRVSCHNSQHCADSRICLATVSVAAHYRGHAPLQFRLISPLHERKKEENQWAIISSLRHYALL
jgi:hypothetical protein